MRRAAQKFVDFGIFMDMIHRMRFNRNRVIVHRTRSPDMTTTLDKVLYTGVTRVTGGRDGAARSTDGRLDVPLAHFNSRAPGTNPEQLLAAGWGACYLGALQIAAREAELSLPTDAAIEVEVDLGLNPGNDYRLRARFKVELPGIDAALAQRLAERAHATCPYSKALHGNLEVTTTVA
jgi:osmotically inducible protein OsmC